MAERIEPIDPSRDLSVSEAFRDEALAGLAEEFIRDLEARLAEIRSGLGALPAGDVEALRRLRGAVHSLKGAGGTNGYEVISLVCHAFEELLDRGAHLGRLASEGMQRAAGAYVDLLAWIRELAASGATCFRDAIPEINRVIEASNEALAEGEATEPREAFVHAGAPRVLIVDAPGLYRRMLERLVEEDGARPAAADGVPQGLARLAAEPFAAAVVVGDLEGISGSALVAAMKVDPGLRAIPVILIGTDAAVELPEELRPDRTIQDGTAARVLAALRSVLGGRVRA